MEQCFGSLMVWYWFTPVAQEMQDSHEMQRNGYPDHQRLIDEEHCLEMTSLPAQHIAVIHSNDGINTNLIYRRARSVNVWQIAWGDISSIIAKYWRVPLWINTRIRDTNLFTNVPADVLRQNVQGHQQETCQLQSWISFIYTKMSTPMKSIRT